MSSQHREQKDADREREKKEGRSEVVDSIVKAYNRISQGINPSFLAKMSLTIAQMKALFLFEDNKKFSMSELSSLYSVSVSTMTSMVDRLFQNGMLKREQDENDRRIVLVSLTAKGRKVLTKLVDARREVLESFLYTLDEDEVKRFDRAMNDAAYFLGRARENIRTGR
jgi:DNA-binding MarR family transcriptional regulator